jgi:hypothetical protein
MPRHMSRVRVAWLTLLGVASITAGSTCVTTAPASAQATPTITALMPNSGASAGGYTVRMEGTGLTGATSIGIERTDVTPIAGSVTDTSLKFIMPSCAEAFRNAGPGHCVNGSDTVLIDVTTPDGTSDVGCTSNFYYDDTGTNIPTTCQSQGQPRQPGGHPQRGEHQHTGHHSA